MQAGTATLNPTSLPFFPRAADPAQDIDRVPSTAPRAMNIRQHDSRSSSSSTASDYRSLRSSPSPQAAPAVPARGQDTPVALGLPVPPSVSVSIPGASSLSTTTGSTRSSMITENMSSSPTSSAGSQRDVVVVDPSAHFDLSLKGSRLVNDMFDRLVRCEQSISSMQRDLSDVNRKLNVLIDRSIATTVNNAQAAQDAMQFRNPFAASQPIITPVSASPSQFSINGSSRGPPKEDMAQMAQQISSLNSSVSQLLALQTQQQQQQQQQQQRSQSLAGPGGIGLGLPPSISHAADQLSSSAGQGSLLTGRPGPTRTPNPPMRTWSQGSLDVRPPPDNALINRTDPRNGGKRGSVVGLLRRDSSGMLDAGLGDNWTGGSPRDGGPTISKWENLPILPELLRSIAKYGVGPPNKIQQRALPFLLRGADIIAQAPPTQERIAAYVIPAIQIALTWIANKPVNRGPFVVIVSTTVDQATQAQRMIRDLGGPIGVRSALGVGSAIGTNEVANEVRVMSQSMPHILCGTPQKLHAMFTNANPLPANEVRLLVLDEVDQLIARNLHDFVFNIVKLLPPPRSRPLPSNSSPLPGSQLPFGSYNEPGTSPSAPSPFQTQPRRFPSGIITPGLSESPSSSLGPFGSAGPASVPSSAIGPSSSPPLVERQTALFSNTVPQDVLNLATAIQLREPVRVLVRRDGNVTHADTSNGARGLRQFYLYLAFTAGGGRLDGTTTPGAGLGIIGSGRGQSSAETAQAREWKLEALADLFDDVEVTQAIVHVGGMTALDSVVYKLASRGIDAVPLHGDMAPGAKLTALNKFRATNSLIMRQPVTKVLVVYDVQVKSPDVFQVPLVINYDLPKAVEEYAHRVAPAISSNYSRAGVVVNFVTATGGDVEMLRSIECFYKIKCPEVPMSLRDVI